MKKILFTLALLVSFNFYSQVTNENIDLYVINYFSGNISTEDFNNLDVSNVTDMFSLFSYRTNNDPDLDLSNWDVSNVTNMKKMFWGYEEIGSCCGFFDEDPDVNINIANWDVSSVTDMSEMFSHSEFNIFMVKTFN